jgi:hypothetical protein
MINLKYSFFALLMLLVATSCTEDDELPQISEVAAPSNISVLFTIAPDNSGEVTIQPNGQGVTAYTVFFGDGSDESAEIGPGETAQHVYTEGTYTVVIEAMGINGKITEFSQDLTVSFSAPENLQVEVLPVPGDPFSIEVSATADMETFFEVYFGETDDEEPVMFMEGEAVQYTYSEVGDYELRVVARSGGTASIEFTQTVTISNPLLLPIDFESTTQGYAFENFGGAESTVVPNPDMSDGNMSSRVAQLNKMDGSEVWAGSFLELGEPIDFSQDQLFSLKVWSPQANIPILMKLENATDGDIFVELEQTITTANAWEEIVFDFSGEDLDSEYSKIVLFFDFGTAGTGANYYFDDIRLTDGLPDVAFPVDFENFDIPFDGFGNANALVIDNPDASGINTSNRVVEFIKADGSETWGGVFFDMDNPITFAAGEKVRMKVWSPKAGAAVLLKFENLADGDIFTELSVPTTVENEWEVLEFDFTGVDASNDYQRVVLFFDFGVNGTGEAYYFDDLELAN